MNSKCSQMLPIASDRRLATSPVFSYLLIIFLMFLLFFAKIKESSGSLTHFLSFSPDSIQTQNQFIFLETEWFTRYR